MKNKIDYILGINPEITDATHEATATALLELLEKNPISCNNCGDSDSNYYCELCYNSAFDRQDQ